MQHLNVEDRGCFSQQSYITEREREKKRFDAGTVSDISSYIMENCVTAWGRESRFRDVFHLYTGGGVRGRGGGLVDVTVCIGEESVTVCMGEISVCDCVYSKWHCVCVNMKGVAGCVEVYGRKRMKVYNFSLAESSWTHFTYHRDTLSASPFILTLHPSPL